MNTRDKAARIIVLMLGWATLLAGFLYALLAGWDWYLARILLVLYTAVGFCTTCVFWARIWGWE